MSVTLGKGEAVTLRKHFANLRKVAVGLGWTSRQTAGADFDLDASALMLGPDNVVLSDRHFVFYNQLKSPDGSVQHTGDDLTGGDGSNDDEVINVDLDSVPAECTRIVFPVSIYDAVQRRQSFGQVRAAFIRIVDRANDREFARYDLTENASTETAMIFGELFRNNSGWEFRAVGQGYDSGLDGIVRAFGIKPV